MITRTLHQLKSTPVRLATSTSVITGFLGQALLLISGPLAARILGVEDRGYLALLTLFPLILSYLIGGGMPKAVTYQLSKSSDRVAPLRQLLFAMFSLQSLGIIAIHSIILWFYLDAKPDHLRIVGYLSLGLGPMFLAQQYALAILQGLGLFSRLNVLRLLAPFCYSMYIAVIYFYGEGDLIIVAFGWVAIMLFSGITLIFFSFLLLPKSAHSSILIEKPLLKEMGAFGLKGFIGSMAPVETFQVGQLAAGLFLSPYALGLYVVGQAFCNLSGFVAKNAALVAFPTVASQEKSGAGISYVWKFFWAVTLFNIVMTAILIASVPILIPFLFGLEFSGSVFLAQVLLVGATFSASRRILVEGLQGLGYPQISTYAEVSMYPWLLPGGAYMTMEFGVEGLVAAISIGYLISLIVAVIATVRVKESIANSAI